MRRDIYISQYLDIVEWKNKYFYIMDNLKDSEESVISLEQTEIGKLFELRKLYRKFLSKYEYEKENFFQKKLRLDKEKYNSEDCCYDCEELVCSVIKHDLRYTADKKDAYYYVVKKAFEELSDISKNTIAFIKIKHFDSLDESKKAEILPPYLKEDIENKDVDYYSSKDKNESKSKRKKKGKNKLAVSDLKLASLLNEMEE